MSKYYNFRNLDILFVDDNKNMHSLLKSLLLAMNVVNSRGCYTSEECFDCMLEEAPDIVITDMSLNPENGIDLIRRIRQGEKGVDRYTPILVLSGQTALKHDRLVWMIENPRPFIKASTYIGPDRRRAMRGYEGMERRQ